MSHKSEVIELFDLRDEALRSLIRDCDRAESLTGSKKGMKAIYKVRDKCQRELDRRKDNNATHC